MEAEFLRQRGMSLEPDAVILGFLVNDFRNSTTQYKIDERGYLVTAGGGNPRLHLQSLLYETSDDKPIWQRLIESSHLIRWASGRKVPAVKQPLMQFNDKDSKTITFDAIKQIADMTRQADIPFYVCLFPYVEHPVPDSDKSDLDEMALVCRELDIPNLRMETAIQSHPVEELWVHPRDHHPNAIAHELYAKLIYRSFFKLE
jgi:hypothetical protein